MVNVDEAAWQSEDFRSNDTTLLEAMGRAYGFLTHTFGFELLYRSAHFRGHFLVYSTDRVRVAVEFNPETTKASVDIYPTVDLRPGAHARMISAEGLLAMREPSRSWGIAEHSPPYTFHELVAGFELWAEGLKTLAADILRGEGLDTLRWGRAW